MMPTNIGAPMTRFLRFAGIVFSRAGAASDFLPGMRILRPRWRSPNISFHRDARPPAIIAVVFHDMGAMNIGNHENQCSVNAEFEITCRRSAYRREAVMSYKVVAAYFAMFAVASSDILAKNRE